MDTLKASSKLTAFASVLDSMVKAVKEADCNDLQRTVKLLLNYHCEFCMALEELEDETAEYQMEDEAEESEDEAEEQKK